tara:strand:- start:35227 stop:37551 length:2325 start_codon:yes stop_codon:yes gene_type:complete
MDSSAGMAQLPTKPPLSGVRVLDCGTAGVGPWAASLLGFLGASVVKVEPPEGEFIRQMYPRRNGVGTAYAAFNAGQRVVPLDLKDPADLECFDQLVRDSDVLIENFRAGVAQRLSMDYERVKSINPAIVYASSSAWGDSGPMRDFAAVDPHLQAFSGFASLNGEAGGDPQMLRYMHIDPNGSVHLAALVMLGLLQRRRTGAGMHLGTSHFAMALAMQGTRIAEHFATNQPLPRLGTATVASAPNACFATQDGVYIAITAENQAQWQRLCEAIQREDLLQDSRFANNQARCDNREALTALLQEQLLRYPLRWWTSRLEKAQVPHSRLLDFDDLRFHSQIHANAYLEQIDTPDGSVTVGGLPWKFSRTAAVLSTANDGAPAAFATPSASAIADSLPLQGQRILDVSEGYSGPMLALYLAEAGAEVTKVERLQGDWARELQPAMGEHSSAQFEALNRNKEGVVVDPLDSGSMKALEERLAASDVVIYDRNSSLAQALQLADGAITQRFPGLLLMEINAYGSAGPMADHPGSELALQAMTGYLRNLGSPQGPPVRVGADIAASGAAVMALVGVLAALYERQTSGLGQRVECSQLGTLMAMRSLRWVAVEQPDDWQGTDCNATTDQPWFGYKTGDGLVWPSLRTVRNEADLQRIFAALKLPDEMLRADAMRDHARETIGLGFLGRHWHQRWDAVMSEFTRNEVLDAFRAVRGIAVEFCELHEVIAHPQTATLNLVDESRGQRYLRAPWQAPWARPPVQAAPQLHSVSGVNNNEQQLRAL